MADIVMPLRYILSTSARWVSVRIVCFRVILLANLVPSSYGYLLPGFSIETSPLSIFSSIEARQSQALLTFFKFCVDKGTKEIKGEIVFDKKRSYLFYFLYADIVILLHNVV